VVMVGARTDSARSAEHLSSSSRRLTIELGGSAFGGAVGTSGGMKARACVTAVIAALVVGGPGVAGAQDRHTAVPGGSKGCVPGAPGVGDAYYPTYGNGGYDVGHYDLDIAYDPTTDVLEGHAKIKARATQNLCSFNLDLVGLTVRSIEVNNQAATWSRSGQELVVTPQRPLKSGKRFKVEISYDGVPIEFVIPGFDIPAGFMTTPDGVTVAGQPEVATAWFPVNDHPIDKASYSFDITVPSGYEVVANGVLRGREHRHRGSTTWRWEAREPMASYLATIDIGFWDVDRGRTASGLAFYDAVDSAITGGLRAEIDSSLARQGEILGMLSDAFGPYPFDTVGGIVDSQDDLFFALETQTRPVYSMFFWLDGEGNPANGDFVVVHELAHQWFGDDVALARWQDIWLNEGFATYAEWLWEEYEGRATPQEIFQATYDAIPADDPFWSVVIGDPGVDLLFDNAVYVRGAMTLQALRNEVGDDAFWAIVRGWAAVKSGGNATTDEFIAFAEQVSGQQLDELFEIWLFTAGKPTLATSAAALSTQPSPEPASQARTRADTWLADLERRLQHGRF
jgi:aminopeptidase N